MATSPHTFRLEEDLSKKLRDQAEQAGLQLSTHISQIVESHLADGAPNQPAVDAEYFDHITQSLRQILGENHNFQHLFAQKSRETNTDMKFIIKQIDELRVDLSTAFAALLQILTEMDADAAADWVRRHLKPPPKRS